MIATPTDHRFLQVEGWPLAYRFTEEPYNKLDPRTLATIRPLADESALRLAQSHDLVGLVGQARNNLLTNEWQTHTIHGDVIHEEEYGATTDWLRQRRPHASDDVYVEWSGADACAAVVAWQTLCRCFDDFWYPFEVVLVSDDTREWQVLFGPNDIVRWRTLGPGEWKPAAPRREAPNVRGGKVVDPRKYFDLRDAGASAREVYRCLQEDGASGIESLVTLRRVFGISLREAMEIARA